LSWRDKVEQAARQSSRKSFALANYQKGATANWFLATIGLAVYALSKYSYQTKFDRGFADYAYVCAISAFTIGIGFAALGYTSSKNAEKKGLAMVLLLVDIVATCTYGLHFLRLSPALKDANGYPVDVGRYIEWLTCCPSLIALIGNVTRNTTIVQRSMTHDYILVITGFFASILKQPWSELFLIISCGSHCVVVTGLYDMFTDAIEGKTACNLDKTALKLSRAACMFAWNACKLVRD
jgi:bacteriorhodopsin